MTLKSQIDTSLEAAKTGLAEAGKKLGDAVQHGIEGAGEVAAKAATAVQEAGETAVKKAKKGAEALADATKHAAEELADAAKDAASEVKKFSDPALRRDEKDEVAEKVRNDDPPSSDLPSVASGRDGRA